MKVCDKCHSEKSFDIHIIFEKKISKSKAKRMLNVPLHLCDACISTFLKEFGEFKWRYLKPKSKDVQ